MELKQEKPEMHEKPLKRRAFLAAAGGMVGGVFCGFHGSAAAGNVLESGGTVPLPLQRGGEKLNLLVRVDDKARAHNFNLVFVEERAWPKEKSERLRRTFRGRMLFDSREQPYPVRLRFQLSVPGEDKPVKIDEIVNRRDSAYATRYPNETEIWRAHRIYSGVLDPGVYRVQIENLFACFEFDFSTLLQFERNNRIY